MRPDQAARLYDSLFSSDKGFGVDETTGALYTKVGGGSPVAIRGIFLSRPIDIVMSDAAPIADVISSFTCMASDLPSGAVGGDAGDTLTMGAVVYRVLDIQADEAGKVILPLGASS